MEQEEIWKDIAGYEGLYQVSNMGRVKSLRRVLNHGHKWSEKLLKPGKTPTGYHVVCLSRNRKQRLVTVHRLVAKAFIPNDDVFATTVNHKNEVKTDNRVENLEWMSPGDNTRYSEAGPNGNKWGNKNRKSKPVRCVETGDVFVCASDASRSFGLHVGTISGSIRHGLRAGGYHWEYVEQDKQQQQ